MIEEKFMFIEDTRKDIKTVACINVIDAEYSNISKLLDELNDYIEKEHGTKPIKYEKRVI